MPRVRDKKAEQARPLYRLAVAAVQLADAHVTHRLLEARGQKEAAGEVLILADDKMIAAALAYADSLDEHDRRRLSQVNLKETARAS